MLRLLIIILSLFPSVVWATESLVNERPPVRRTEYERRWGVDCTAVAVASIRLVHELSDATDPRAVQGGERLYRDRDAAVRALRLCAIIATVAPAHEGEADHLEAAAAGLARWPEDPGWRRGGLPARIIAWLSRTGGSRGSD